MGWKMARGQGPGYRLSIMCTSWKNLLPGLGGGGEGQVGGWDGARRAGRQAMTVGILASEGHNHHYGIIMWDSAKCEGLQTRASLGSGGAMVGAT